MIQTPSPSTQWHQQEVASVLSVLNSHLDTGLSEAEAAQRLATYGANELEERERKSPFRIFWEQISSTMVLILIAAAVASGVLGKVTETAAISAIVLLFAILGFVQEYRAEQAMAALKKLAVPTVRVRRNGQVKESSAQMLVIGDVVMLESGNVVPADVRFLESVNLRIQEAALTGESEAVEKETSAIEKADVPLGDRRNMGYMGTLVTYGRGAGVVVATGMQTELGKIATLLQDVGSEMTPLQKRLDQVGKQLAILGLIVAAVVLGIGVWRNEPLEDMFLTAISVAVAVVPEGLPAVVTVTLALGAQRMLRRRALIRKLPAVETLGSVTVICSDKTGTLTENRMTVTVIDVAGYYLELQGTGKHPAPALQMDANALLERQPLAIGLLLAGGALCNDASLVTSLEARKSQAVGDPTEGALLVAASQVNLFKEELQKLMPRVAELPFDSDRKRMSTVHRLPEDRTHLPHVIEGFHHAPAPYVAITKGAVDGLLELSTHVWDNDRPISMTNMWRDRIHQANDQMAQKGMRVLGLAVQWVSTVPSKGLDSILEKDLTFVGLVGMIDPPRPEVQASVKICRNAGIRPIMITGDHPLTARFIASELGISHNGRVLTGQELNKLSAGELDQAVKETSVFARVSPEHKLRIVEALQKQGEVTAMTGDGVNDSPALKKADIGIAMGITGTDVSKEASEMVLLDDNFATIVSAVEEGRVIYDNIRRFVKFSIAGNIGKVIVMVFAPVLVGVNVALLPLQLLWLNLLTDGLLGLGLGVEPAEKDTMNKPPRSPKASLFDQGLGLHVVWVGLLAGIIGIGLAYLFYNPANPTDQTWQTMLFTTLAFLQVGQGLASRSTKELLWQQGLFSNPTMLGLSLTVILLQLIVVYVPFFDEFFKIKPLTMTELLICAGTGSLLFIAIEIEKFLLGRKSNHV